MILLIPSSQNECVYFNEKSKKSVWVKLAGIWVGQGRAGRRGADFE
jgi:hypothetical protein